MKAPRIDRAIDVNLSGLRLSAFQKEQIMRNIYGGAKVKKKKLSLALAVTLVLLALTAAAVAAALLSGKQVVDQVIQPMAEKNESQMFTREEVEEILAFADKQGIALDEESLRWVRKEGGYYKEELAMLFAKADLGRDPDTWSVEDQHWFGEFRVKISNIGINHCTIPKEGELSQEEIEAKAAAYIAEWTGNDYPLNDPEKYLIRRGFAEVKLNPFQSLREWYLNYEPRDMDLPAFSLKLSPSGQVKDYSDNVAYVGGQVELDTDEQLMRIFDDYQRLYADRYGSIDTFTQAQWQEMRRKMDEVQGKSQYSGMLYDFIRVQGYGPLPEGAITEEQAIAAAAEAVSQKFKVDQDKLLTPPEDRSGMGKFIHAIYLSHGYQQVWKVSFERDYLAEIDAMTGEAKVVDAYYPGNYWGRRYVLDKLLQPEQKAYATPMPELSTWAPGLPSTPYPQRQEGIEAPQAYWDALQAIGYNGDTAQKIWDGVNRDYGEDRRFWPLNMQALYEYRFNPPTGGDAGQGELSPFAGIPLPEDIPEEKAIEIAWKEMRSGAHGLFDEGYVEALKPALSYRYHFFKPGSHSYHVTFVDVSGELPRDVATIDMDALTGKVIAPEFSDTGKVIGNVLLEGFKFGRADIGSDGRPRVWGNKDIPQYYWDIMEERQDTYEGVIRLLMAAERKYGELSFFWPLLEKSLLELWTMPEIYQGDHGLMMSGLPAESDIPQEKAEEIAWEAFKKATAEKYTQEDYDAVKLAVGFVFNQYAPGGRTWTFEFADSRREKYHTLGMMSVDAITGEVVFINVERGNG